MKGEIKEISVERIIQHLWERGTFLGGGVAILGFILGKTWVCMYIKRKESVKVARLKIKLSERHEK